MTTRWTTFASLCRIPVRPAATWVCVDPRALDSFVGCLDTNGGDAALPS